MNARVRLPILVTALVALAASLPAQIDTVQTLAPGVYFHQGDIRRGHSNNGWIVFDDFVLVVEANFPSGAKIVLPKVKATSDRPIRFAFNTHHHGDHAYGNQLWADAGATIVATEGVLAEMKIADDSSKRFTKALTDAGNVLNANQRQAFFKTWSDHKHGPKKG